MTALRLARMPRQRRRARDPLGARCGTGRTARAQQPAGCGPQDGKLALVLAGGGARDSRMGILRMLDSLGIVPDLVVGTSAGAMVGALYASGLAVDDITTRRSARAWTRSSGGTAPSSRRRSATGGPSSRGRGRAGLRPPDERRARGAAERADDVALPARQPDCPRQLRPPADPVPRRRRRHPHRRQVVLGTGDLAQAVRAKQFDPDRLPHGEDRRARLVDGIANNVPIEVARSPGATRLIISALLDTVVSDKGADDPLSVAAQMVSLLFEQTLPTVRPGRCDGGVRRKRGEPARFSADNIRGVIAAGDKAAASLRDDQCPATRPEAPHGWCRRSRRRSRAGAPSPTSRVLRVTLGARAAMPPTCRCCSGGCSDCRRSSATVRSGSIRCRAPATPWSLPPSVDRRASNGSWPARHSIENSVRASGSAA